MIRGFINIINERLTGYDKLYCLLEKKGTANNLEYSEGGQFAAIPYDEFGVAGYWRYRTKISVETKPAIAACNRKQIITFPLYFVAWFNRDNVGIEPEQFAANATDVIHTLYSKGEVNVKATVKSIEMQAEKAETGKETDVFTMLRMEVDVVLVRICATCDVNIPECETLCEQIETVQWLEIKACMSDAQVESAIADLCGLDPCEIISEATAQEIVDCLAPEQLGPLQELICESPEDCTTVQIVANLTELNTIENVEGCPKLVGFNVTDQDDNTLPVAWVDGVLQVTVEPPVCDPATVTLEGVPIATITNPCGSLTELTCATPAKVVIISGAGDTEVNGTYIPNGNISNGQLIYYLNGEVGNFYIVWTGSQWRLLSGDGSVRYYFAVGANPWDNPWDLAQDGQAPAPTAAQGTIGDICQCSCDSVYVILNDNEPVLVSIVDGEITFPVVDQLGNPLAAAIVDGEIEVTIPPPSCDPVTTQINGANALNIPSGEAVNIITLGANGDVFPPRSIDDTVPNVRTLRFWIPAPAKGASHTTLIRVNPFGNTTRFTDGAGGTTFAAGVFYDWTQSCWNESAGVYEVLEVEIASPGSTSWTNQGANAAGVGKRMLYRREWDALMDLGNSTNVVHWWPGGSFNIAIWCFEEYAPNTTNAWYVASFVTSGYLNATKATGANTRRCRMRQFTISGSTVTFL